MRKTLKNINGAVKNQKGFTLVELIIVIAIIGILSAAAIPRVLQYIDKARIASDTQTAISYENAIEILLADRELRIASDAALYIVNKGAAIDNPTAVMTGISNKSKTVSLDIYIDSLDAFSNGNGQALTPNEIGTLFENIVKITSFNYYDGVKINLERRGSTGYSFVE